MLNIFNYNSRSFTLLAILFLIGIAYNVHKDDYSVGKKAQVISPEEAKYVLKVDPDHPQTFLEKVALFFFKDKLLEAKAPVTSNALTTSYKIKYGDKVKILFFSDKVERIPMPQIVEVPSASIPIPANQALLEMEVGQRKKININDVDYHIMLIEVISTGAS